MPELLDTRVTCSHFMNLVKESYLLMVLALVWTTNGVEYIMPLGCFTTIASFAPLTKSNFSLMLSQIDNIVVEQRLRPTDSYTSTKNEQSRVDCGAKDRSCRAGLSARLSAGGFNTM